MAQQITFTPFWQTQSRVCSKKAIFSYLRADRFLLMLTERPCAYSSPHGRADTETQNVGIRSSLLPSSAECCPKPFYLLKKYKLGAASCEDANRPAKV